MAKGKRIDISTLEQARHEDLVRGDALTTAACLEIMRGLVDDQRWPMTYSGTVQRASGAEAPLRAQVLSGLLVRPDNNTYLTVDAGQLLAAVTPASSDDSVIELVDDPGVVSPGALLFVANGGGGARVDIVEVSVVDTTIETATRGVYNVGTRVFDPTSVPKVHAPRLSYRIRAGTPGAGLPAMVSGWLPLCVIVVPTTAASFVSCVFWDVRPLVADRVQFGTPPVSPDGDRSKFEQPVDGRWISNLSLGLSGYATSQFGGYLAGGKLTEGYYYWNATGNQFQEPGFALSANTMVHFAVVFPGGLPRWVRYFDSTIPGSGLFGSRVPLGLRGVPMWTNSQPRSDGRYDALTPPTASGFTATAPGVALATQLVDNSGTRITGACIGGRKTVFQDNCAAALPNKVIGSGQVTWTFIPRTGVIVPAHAKSIDIQLQMTTATDGSFELTSRNQAADTDPIWQHFFSYYGATAPGRITIRDVPLATAVPWLADAGTVEAQTYLKLITPGAISAAVAYVVGYSL